MSDDRPVGVFATKLEERRRQLGMTNGALAALLGRNAGECSRVRHGHRQPTTSFVKAVITVWPEFASYWAADLTAQARHPQTAHSA